MTDDTADRPNNGEHRLLAESIVDTVREPLLILHEDLRVQSANRAFYDAFRVGRAETEGRMVYELGDGQWDIPRLREMLDEVLPERREVEAYEVEHEFEDVGRRVMLLNARTLPREGARPPLILVAIDDVTERRRAEWLLAHEKELAEKIVDTVREPLLVLHEDLRVQSANRAFYDAFKVERAETEGRMVYDLGDGQWDIPELRRLLTDVLPDNEFFEDFEVEHEFEKIGRRTMLLNAQRVDHLQLILLAFEDVTERRRAEAERELLIGELNHRVKNLLAVVRALAAQGDGRRSVEEYRETFVGRLDALVRAHDLALESQWRGIDLRTLAGHTLEPYAADRPETVEVDGEPVELESRQALSVSLVLHELATNALKYGALSAPAGRVRLAWRIVQEGEGRRLHLRWEERGGPVVEPPREGGFGTRLIERAFGYELGGEAALDFRSEGLNLEARFPLP